MPAILNIFLLIPSGILLMIAVECWSARKKSRSLEEILYENGNISILNTRHLSGIAIFTTCCWFYATSSRNAAIFSTDLNTEWLLFSGAMVILALATGYISAARRQKALAENVPAVREILPYLFIRMIFLLSYEFFFRGVLLFTMLEYTSPVIAVTINILLYALVHCQSSQKEIIGTLPFGVLLCFTTILHQSVWPAAFIHLALAMGHEIRLLLQHHSTIKPHQV